MDLASSRFEHGGEAVMLAFLVEVAEWEVCELVVRGVVVGVLGDSWSASGDTRGFVVH